MWLNLYLTEQIKKKHEEESSELRENIMKAKVISETISKVGNQLYNTSSNNSRIARTIIEVQVFIPQVLIGNLVKMM